MKVINEAALAALESGEAIVTGAVRIGLAAPARFWGGDGSRVIGGEAYVGVGSQASVEVSGGTLGGRAEGAQMTLSGVDPLVASAVDFRALRGVPVVLWWLIFNSTGRILLDEIVYLRGRVDSAPKTETVGGTAIITLGVEGSARGLGRRSERMRTDADQNLILAGDTAMKRVSFAGDKVLYSGGKPPARAGQVLGGTSPAVVDGTLGRPYTGGGPI